MRKSFLLVLALLSANAFAADYVQGPRSSLAFAGKYQGELFIAIGDFEAARRNLDYLRIVCGPPGCPEQVRLAEALATAERRGEKAK